MTRPARLTLWLTGLLTVLLAGGQTAWAAPMVWFLDPGAGDIVRVDPRTGAELGRFAAPLKPAVGDTRAGLSLAEGGRTLLYQLGGNGVGDLDGRDMLFRLDPLTGVVKSTELGLTTAFGPDGLSWQKKDGHTYTFFSHANPIPDIHRIEDLGSTDEEEVLFYGPTSESNVHPVGGLGGDGNQREFGAFRIFEVPGEETGPLFIGEYDPFNDSSFLNTFAPPAQDIEGLAFDGTFLYASSSSGLLFTLDPDTGQVIRSVLLPGVPDLADTGPYVFDIAAGVPEPSVLALVVLGGIGVARRRRR